MNNSEIKLTFIDLFAGIGGMRIAYEQNNCKCVYSSEWNKYSQQTYAANFGETPDGDITKVKKISSIIKIKYGTSTNHPIRYGWRNQMCSLGSRKSYG